MLRAGGEDRVPGDHVLVLQPPEELPGVVHRATLGVHIEESVTQEGDELGSGFCEVGVDPLPLLQRSDPRAGAKQAGVRIMGSFDAGSPHFPEDF